MERGRDTERGKTLFPLLPASPLTDCVVGRQHLPAVPKQSAELFFPSAELFFLSVELFEQSAELFEQNAELFEQNAELFNPSAGL